MNHLLKENCNKSKCKSCMFGPNPIELSQERLNEIYSYLIKFESSHLCHTTNKTCYGALELQAKILYGLNVIPNPSVESLLIESKKFLKSK